MVEAGWDVTFIMKEGRIVRECRRADLEGQRLEDIYFSIFEGGQ
jgi:hypothetical protein